MANLNNQNYCLQKELEGFIEADDQVRRGLDRKHQVEQIRSKVDDVIRRSQYEVQQRINQAASSRRDTSANKSENMASAVESRQTRIKSAQNYSPLRESYKINS